VVAAHVVVDRAVRKQSAAAELALVSLTEANSARAVLESLDGFVIGSESRDGRAERNRLTWDVERMVHQERERLAQGGTAASGLAQAAERALVLAKDPEPTPEMVSRIRGEVRSQVLPQLNLHAARHRAEAAQAAIVVRWTIFASLALHLLGGIGLVLGVLRPARKRIVAWVAQSDETERENRFRLLHDALTGLPNATFLHAYLSRLAAGAERASTHTAVLRVDLDRFKVLAETLGKNTCDEVIRIVSRRIQRALRNEDFAAYLGGDDFVVVASDLEGANAAAAVAGRVQTALAKPFSIKGGARRITCGIGVTLLSDDTPDPDRILANASIALAEAQGAGAGNVRYFREDLRAEVDRRETLYTELLAGLDRGELEPFFQPQIDLATGAFSGFEALIRWHHPEHGLLTPAAFLDFADETDLTERIGGVVLARALEALRTWEQAGLDVPEVGVNFALAQLRDPRLIEKIKWETERFDIDPSRIAIEVLETVLIKSDADMVVRNLRGLASAGFRIELDDFGTGHASISNRRRFMVNRIKIDKSFIFGIETSAEQQQLTASMIAMAPALGIGTLAEGVETEPARAILANLGCNCYQGYLAARPMSLSESLAWLADRSGVSAPRETPEQATGDGPNTP
jgi:diguanylate cyclase (GGDEF)-like protein